jgi:AcrR family transcriptional regulator
MSVRILGDAGGEQPVTTSEASAEPANRVHEILRAACRVVVQEGAHALRVGNVAQEAGVSRTLVHYYFTTRQELMRAAFAFSEDRRVEALEAELAGLPTGEERATRALRRTLDPEVEETAALWNEVWSGLRDDEDLRPLVQARYRAWAERIVQLLDEGRSDGSVPAWVDPEAAGWRLAAVADGLDSIRFLGLLDVGGALELLGSAIDKELGR